MKMFFSSFLALAFLLPAVASADSYCVSFPTGGESKWTKRDNSINVRFKYDFKSEVRETSFGERTTKNFTTTGVPKGSGKENRIKAGYTSYRYGATDLCINNPMPYRTHNEAPPVQVRLDVKWGGDCDKVALRYNRIRGDHKFEIYRRKGDLVNPFGCRRKK